MNTPGWQRVVSGLFALGAVVGILTQTFDAFETVFLGWYRYFTIAAGLFGAYLFAVVAIKGKFPDWFVRRKTGT